MAKKQKDGADAPVESGAEGTQKIKIQSFIFTAPMPYSEGHVLTAVEAKVLNQTFSENLRNNFAKRVKDATTNEDGSKKDLDADASAALHAAFAEYASSYTFAAPRQASVVDPVEKIARQLARAVINAKVVEKKWDKKTLAEDFWDKNIDALLAKDPKYMEEARRRHEATKEIASQTLEDILA